MDFDAVTDDLFAGSREEFVGARDALAAQVRKEGDRGLAARITGLRKPTTSAWLINRIAREHPRDIAKLARLGKELRAAHENLAGTRLRALSRKRQELIQSLLGIARETGDGVTDPVATEVESTLSAALGDPDLARAIATGRLQTAIDASTDQWLTAALAGSAPAREPELKQRRGVQKEAVPPARPRPADRNREDRAREERHRARQDVTEAGRARRDAERAVAKLERQADKAADAVNDLRARLADAERQERDARKQLGAAQDELDSTTRKAEDAQLRLDDLG
ncbi:MAG: hypothetical protein ACRDSE_04785 [Pseudonocardiaceae bacterium]